MRCETENCERPATTRCKACGLDLCWRCAKSCYQCGFNFCTDSCLANHAADTGHRINLPVIRPKSGHCIASLVEQVEASLERER